MFHASLGRQIEPRKKRHLSIFRHSCRESDCLRRVHYVTFGSYRAPRVTALQQLGTALHERQRWLVTALLALLHLALVSRADAAISLLCWLVDVGLFILWQPFVYAERKIDLGGLTVMALVLGGGIIWYGDWLLIVWVVMLAALVGGRVMFIDHRPTRVFYLAAFAYLLAALLFELVPRAVPESTQLGPSLDREFAWGMPVVLLLMTLLPFSGVSDRCSGGMIDLFYSLFIFLLIAVLVLGSLAFMLFEGISYLAAVVDTLLAMAAVLFLIGWAWNTRPGFTGIGVFFSRYLLSIGLPLENWLHRLTTLAAQEIDPDKFLAQALAEMLDLPWVAGGAWSAGARRGTFGSSSRFSHDFASQPLHLSLYTRHRLSPALVWHFHLLARLANEHYVAKLRARELQQLGYMRAIHETGARLTHDVKNLLQSLNNLCYLVQASRDDGERCDLILQRQLPQITQRLQHALNKLRQPHSEPGGLLSAELWWRIQQQRYAHSPVGFTAVDFARDALVPAVLFDAVLDNLLHNALGKASPGGDLHVRVVLTADASLLSVCDNGEPIGDEVLADLLQAPVASAGGLGIGLYQSAQEAASCGFCLRLASNVRGRVCFELRRASRPVGDDCCTIAQP